MKNLILKDKHFEESVCKDVVLKDLFVGMIRKNICKNGCFKESDCKGDSFEEFNFKG